MTSDSSLSGQVDQLRVTAGRALDPVRQKELGQFMTPAPVARLLASLLVADRPSVSVLDAGAGVGSLFAAVVESLGDRSSPPEHISVIAYEIDPDLADVAERTRDLCDAWCRSRGIGYDGEVRRVDFLTAAADLLAPDLMAKADGGVEMFDVAIQNPPYRKITAPSLERRALRRMGIETTNLYTGFLAVAARMLNYGGELVAITPRSFCNGKYFQSFRTDFLSRMSLENLHLFETRTDAFREDAVLQETLILHARHGTPKRGTVTVTTSQFADGPFTRRDVSRDEIVHPDDQEHIVRILPDEDSADVTMRMARFSTSLADLGLAVSTGRVVHFRVADHLRDDPASGTVPLIWPLHLNGEARTETSGFVTWPRAGARKPNALARHEDTESLLVPRGHYVLIKRFSSKEQARRIMPAIYDPDRLPASQGDGVGFENHLNYIHAGGRGLEPEMARGLAVFLGSTLVDAYFRLSSGHTQVNAADLRRLGYPSRCQLVELGSHVGDRLPAQEEIDELVEAFCFLPLESVDL